MTGRGQRESFLTKIATLWFIGYLPKAPGTWGSVAGVLVIWAVHPSFAVQAGVIAATVLLGIPAAASAEMHLREKDSSHIVIDELAGIFIALFGVPQTPFLLASGFLLFRFFDILKPFPIRVIDRNIHGGIGIMADDIAAGIFANVMLQIWMKVF